MLKDPEYRLLVPEHHCLLSKGKLGYLGRNTVVCAVCNGQTSILSTTPSKGNGNSGLDVAVIFVKIQDTWPIEVPILIRITCYLKILCKPVTRVQVLLKN